MSKKIRKSLLRVMTAVLAVICMFTQLPVTSAFAAGGNIIKLLEKNSFDGLRWASKTPMTGYNGSYTTDIMGVTIDGVNYVAYCLNHDRYGSGDAYGEYSVKVYDLDDPALQSNQEFLNDKNILMYMQGVLASGGYTSGGDSAATALRTRGSSRQLFNNRFEAYGVTKFAMWTLSVGQSDASKWSVNPTATYDASRNQYLLESLNQIMASANNWKDFVDSNVYAVPKTDENGNIIWQEGPEEGEHYVEWEITTGYFGNGKVQDSEHVYMDSTYTLTPASLPSGFHLEKLDGTPITGQTTMQGRYQNAWNGEPFRLVAEDGTDVSSFGEEKSVATIETQLQTGGLKYGIAILLDTLFHINVNTAKQAPGRHLKYPLRCIIDEIANIGKIPKLDILISTTRKYWIYFELIFQDVSQIKAKYRDDAPVILAVCPIKLFLGGSGEETTKYVSEQLLGKATIDTMSYTGSGTSGSLGKNSYSQNQQKTGRSLLDQTELAQLPKSECIVFIKGYPPFRSKKYDVRDHPRYKLLADGDTDGYVFDRNAGKRRTIKTHFVTEINLSEVNCGTYFVAILWQRFDCLFKGN